MLITIAILCITSLEAIAICHGIDGTLFSLSISTIAGLVGWQLKKQQTTRRDARKDIKL